MRHHQYNSQYQFVVEPIEFNKYTEKTTLQYCLGATLYMPGTRDISEKILSRGIPGLTSMVLCFEDAISECDLPTAEANVINYLGKLSSSIASGTISIDDIPLTFCRVRNLDQFRSFTDRLNKDCADILTGFVFPKFSSENCYQYYEILRNFNLRHGIHLYGMPILEGTKLAYIETRMEELSLLKNALFAFKNEVLNIRVGGTDFSSLFGVRRGINYSIYDIMTVRDILSDILNFFNRPEDGFTISAPVWEYFLADKKEDLEHLLEVDIHRSILKGNTILNDAIDGLLREVILDEANGFIGKTIIHPSHLKYVNAMQAVTREAYDDARQVLESAGGVIKSAKSNKMNEISPHRNWAKRVVTRARVFGVIENQASYLQLLYTK